MYSGCRICYFKCFHPRHQYVYSPCCPFRAAAFSRHSEKT